MHSNRRYKRICCYFLAIVMLLSCFCGTTFATEDIQNVDNQNISQNISQEEVQVDDTDMNENEAVEGNEEEIREEVDVTDPIDEAIEVEPEVVSDEPLSASEAAPAQTTEATTVPAEQPTPVVKHGIELVATPILTGKIGFSGAIKLKWKPVEGATSYKITSADLKKTKTQINIVDGIVVGKRTIKDLKIKKQYTVVVKAYNEEGKRIAKSEEIVVSFKSMSVGKVEIKQQTQMRAYDVAHHKFSWASFNWKDGYKDKEVATNRKVTIEWKKPAKEPVRYVILKKTARKGKYKVIARIDDPNQTSYTYSEKVKEKVYKNNHGGNYYYVVKPIFDNGSYLKSKRTDKVHVPKFLSGKIKTYTFYAKTNTTAKFYKQGTGLAYKRWIPAGVKGHCVGGSGSKFYFEGTPYGNGYVMREKLTCYKIDYSPREDWTKERKERYVNHNSSFKTSGKWVVWVSRYTQKINIFKKKNGKWNLVRTCDCATGEFRRYTSSGEYKIHTRTKYRPRSGYYYYYLSRYNQMNSLHGPTYWKSNDRIKSIPFTHLGKNGMGTGTLGCVRTWNEDAKYIWDHMGIGTKVVVY